jgi:tetratricopeptide (TPR) repeat protein
MPQMNRQQLLLIIGSIAMIAVLFFGFDIKPPKHRQLETSRGDQVEWQETENLLRKAKAALPEDLRKYLQGLDNVVSGAPNDSIKIQVLKSLSSAWYDQGMHVLAGYYAERIALITGTEESWAIAGASYGIALTSGENPEHADLALAGAVRCFENAISLNPQNLEHRINLAICYAEHPPAANPMRGIQSLLDLNRNNPDNVAVLYHLARFGMRTGQYDRAMERLEHALSIEPEQRRLNCLMADLLRQTGRMEEMQRYVVRCETVRE